jgi:integrase
LEGISLIKLEQLHGIKYDTTTDSDKAIIFTKEKGGKEGDVLISLEIYKELLEYITVHKQFKIDRQKYSADIRQTCKKLGIPAEGSHAFRWNFAKRRMMEYTRAGYTYEQSLQTVSWEMKHNRANITTVYLGG